MVNQYRTHNCGQLNEKNVNEAVRLSGWLNSKRDHGGLLFVDLRDQYGITQVVVDEKSHSFKGSESSAIRAAIPASGILGP